MQTIFKYNSPPYEFWNGVNWIVITTSNHNNWANSEFNLKWRQWYDWNILLDENLREKRINMTWYIKWTDAQDMLNKLNILKQNIIKRWNYISSSFPLISQELPFLEIDEWTFNVKYEWFFEWLDNLTSKLNWQINFLPLNLNFICPNWYGIWAVRNFNVSLTWNYTQNTNVMFPTNFSNTIVQPWISLLFNSPYNNNITLTIWDDSVTFLANVTTGQQIKISTVSNIIWINKYNTDTSFNSELDFTWVIPRWIRLWWTQFTINFAAAVNADMNVIFQERFI